MKVARLYTMDLDNLEKLGRRVNKSETVNRAVRKYLNDKDAFRGLDCDTIDLIRWLLSKDDISEQLKILLKLEYSLKSNS